MDNGPLLLMELINLVENREDTHVTILTIIIIIRIIIVNNRVMKNWMIEWWVVLWWWIICIISFMHVLFYVKLSIKATGLSVRD